MSSLEESHKTVKKEGVTGVFLVFLVLFCSNGVTHAVPATVACAYLCMHTPLRTPTLFDGCRCGLLHRVHAMIHFFTVTTAIGASEAKVAKTLTETKNALTNQVRFLLGVWRTQGLHGTAATHTRARG